MPDSVRWEKLTGLFLVLVMHGTALYGAWSYRLLPPPPQDAVTLFVNLINPPPPAQKKPEPPPPLPPPQKVKLVKPHPVTAPPPILVANAPVMAPTELMAPPPPPPVPEVQALPGPSTLEPVVANPPQSPEPVLLSSDLAVSCPRRSPPEYPAMSRRSNEQGRVVLRVELDETGRIASARVAESSGFKRLDEAGLAAIKHWYCNATMRNGVVVRAVALQPFDFILEGR